MRIATVIAVCGLIIGAVLQFVWLPRVSAILVNEQAREIRREVEILSEALTPFLLSNQIGAIHETLSGIERRHENWRYLVLRRPDGRLLYPFVEPERATGGELVYREEVVSFRDKDLAILAAEVDLSEQLQRLRTERSILAITLMGLLLLMISSIIMLVDRLVTRPIRKLSLAADELALGNFEVGLPEPSGDEVGHLAASFEMMRDEIAANTTMLTEARRRALEALDAKSRFIATMSHEIRTPLNGVIPVAELLAQSDLDPGQRAKVETIRRSGEVLLSIVNDILDIAMIEGGKLTLKPVTFEPRAAVQVCVDMLAEAATEKGIGLSFKYDGPEGLACVGDRDRLRQVLVNLIGNAVKFTDSGSVTVSLKVTSDETSRVGIAIDVEDTGIGIPAEEQARIFERFEQVDYGKSRGFGGTGLGLSISKSLVAAMGGKIELESQPGAGSRFGIRIDLERAARPATQDAVEEEGATRNGVGRTVLVVDDNPINREVASAMLEKLGLSVALAVDGASALEAVSLKPFDLILMDLHMPDMDGLEATRRIRSGSSPSRSSRVIALTASVQQEDKEACQNAGMDGFLTKPLVANDLKRIVASL